MYDGKYKNDFQHGTAFFTYKDGTLEKRRYEHGNLIATIENQQIKKGCKPKSCDFEIM